MATLNSYLQGMRDMLHDPSDVYWPAAEKTRYINRGLQKRDRDTGQNRALTTFATTIGQDTYTFAALGITTSTQIAFDIIGMNLLYQNLRVVMGCTSFSELNVSVRQFQPLLTWAPLAYCRYSMNSPKIIVAPAPSIAYSIELDVARMVADDYLVNGSDPDPLQSPYDKPVEYYACHLAKMAERQYDEADHFLEMYRSEINDLEANKAGMVPSLYRARLF